MKQRTTDRFLEFFQSNKNSFYTCPELAKIFPDVKESSIWGTAANLRKKGLIVKHNKSYGIGNPNAEEPKPELATEKYCPECGIKKSRKDFKANSWAHDGLNRFCKPCSASRIENGRDDLLKELLHLMPATKIQPVINQTGVL